MDLFGSREPDGAQPWKRNMSKDGYSQSRNVPSGAIKCLLYQSLWGKRTGFIHILCPDIVYSSKLFNITLALSMVLISMAACCPFEHWTECIYDAASFVTLYQSMTLIYIFLRLCPWCWFCMILLKLCPWCVFLYIGCAVHGADIIVTLSMVLILYNVVMALSMVLIPIFFQKNYCISQQLCTSSLS